jgi:hypothetical protein
MSEERQIGDTDLMDVAHDEARTRALRKSLQRLADSPQGRGNGALQEMAREVLSGRVGLREALRVGVYAEALGERVAAGRREFEQLTPEELAQQSAEAQNYLEAQRAEIEQERAVVPPRSSQPGARHIGSDWKL